MDNDKKIKEFLANGGKIEVLPPEEFENKQVIGSTTKKTPELKTLSEGALLYTKKQQNRRNKKDINYSDIDMNYIPKDLQDILGIKDKPKEDNIETN